jgi:hypothetical protein
LLSLSAAGVDLWTAAALVALKKHVSQRLCEAWNQELQSIIFDRGVKEEKEDAGKEKEEPKEESEKEVKKAEEASGEEEKEPQEDTEKETEPKEDGQEGNDGDGKEEPKVEEKGEAITDEKDKEAEKEEDNTSDDDQLRDLCIQWLFDISLLRLSVGNGGGEKTDEFQKLEAAVYERSGLEDSSRQHVDKAAKHFWSRTSLLFGLLA